MKTILKKILIWWGLSALMLVFWIMGFMVGNAIFPSGLMDSSENSNSNEGLLMLSIICALNALIILYFIYHSQNKGWKLVGTVFLVAFGIQYFMSQIETLWFNDSLRLPIDEIWAIVTGGAIMILLFSVAATWFTGNFSLSKESIDEGGKRNFVPMIKKILFLSVIVYPLIYFLAGYLIAWQFAEVRELYSGTADMDSFLFMMKDNVASGLYFFQILRGVLWILIALLVLMAAKGSPLHKGVVLGLLFSILGSSQLLLPNPVMSETVRMAHFIETASSNFIWGFLIAWYLEKAVPTKSNDTALKISIPH